MKLWIVGQWKECTCDGSWEFQGVFDSEEKAINACATDNYWIAPVELNKEWPIESVQIEGAYYPRLEAQPDEI